MKELFNKEKILRNIDSSRLELELYESTTSTNDLCKKNAVKKDFLVISADKQTHGRGRQGKKWHSPSGNICFSIAFMDKDPAMPLSLIAGVIAQKAISDALGTNNIKLKWPNDLICNKKKIGGILVEKVSIGTKLKAIVGIGINLELDEKESWWGDLSSFKSAKNIRNEILNNLIKGFIDFKDGRLVDWMDDWNNNCCHMNMMIDIKNNNEIIEQGKFKGINDKGALLLKTRNDLIEFEFGEISIEGIY